MWIQFLLQGFGRHIQDVAHEMGLAPLPGHPLEVLANRFDQSAMMVETITSTPRKSGFSARRKIHSNWLRIRCRPALNLKFHDNRRH